MNRPLAMIAALFFTVLTVSSVGFAHGIRPLHFTITPARATDGVQVNFRGGEDRSNTGWSSSFKVRELAGLDLANLQASGSRPIQFALVREPGRIDCAGHGGNRQASGDCRFTADPGFASLLAAQGYPRPNEEEFYQMTVAGVGRDLIQAIAAARYERPSLDDLTTLAAVGVTSGYINELTRRGYRPSSIDDLVQFGALEISPEFIDSFARAGYSKLDADTLVEFKALDISPQYAASFERMGYRGLDPDDLVQLKALEVTPSFVEALRRNGLTGLTAGQLGQLRAIDFDRKRSGR